MITESTSERGFNAARLARLVQLERWHFWFVGRLALIDRLLNRHLKSPARRILDLGCGTGLMLERLVRRGHRVVGLDLQPEGLYAAPQALPGSWLLQAEATSLPLMGNAFRVAMLLDVPEHVDDRRLLAEMERVLRPGGLALITLPAMPWLWSYRDEAAGHLRRFTPRQLSRLLTHARLRVEEMR